MKKSNVECKRCGKCCSSIGLPIYFERRDGDVPAMEHLKTALGVKFVELASIPPTLFGRAYVPVTSEEQVAEIQRGELKDKKCPFLDAVGKIKGCAQYEFRAAMCKAYCPGGSLCK